MAVLCILELVTLPDKYMISQLMEKIDEKQKNQAN